MIRPKMLRKVPTFLIIRGLPTSATPGDIRRAVKLVRVEGITDISLIYQRFRPTGKALFEFSTREFLNRAYREIRKTTFMGCENIECQLYTNSEYSQRNRGAKGRADAIKRGFAGSGPSAFFPTGRTVTVTGFRGRTTVDLFKKDYLQGFQLEGDPNTSVLEISVPEKEFTLYKRFVVVLESESEAQRLVRKLHYTPYTTTTTPDQYITAAVVY